MEVRDPAEGALDRRPARDGRPEPGGPACRFIRPGNGGVFPLRCGATDTGEPIGVGEAIDEATEAVSAWRIEQLAERGLDGVEPKARFALLCWDVLGAAEFRVNEARLLGNAVGMDVDTMIAAGLVSKYRRQDQDGAREGTAQRPALDAGEVDFVGAPIAGTTVTRSRCAEGPPERPQLPHGTGRLPCAGTALSGARRRCGRHRQRPRIARRQNWTRRRGSVARLMEALVMPRRRPYRWTTGGPNAAAMFPEFRAWHALLQPLFGIVTPDWTPLEPLQPSNWSSSDGEGQAPA